MSTYKINTVNAQSIKKFMQLSGVKVLRCRQNKNGVLVTVSSETREKAIKFFNEFGLNQNPNASFDRMGVTINGRWDVGTLFNWEKV